MSVQNDVIFAGEIFAVFVESDNRKAVVPSRIVRAVARVKVAEAAC